MKQNMKKIAIALIATNVVASTLITTLPPVQTHAAENKLASTLKATQGQDLINTPFKGDTALTGHIPNGAGKKVTLEISTPNPNYPISPIMATLTTTVDTNNNYSFDLSSTGALGGTHYGFTLRNDKNEIIAARSTQYSRDGYQDGYINKIAFGNKQILSGQFKNLPNQSLQALTTERGNTGGSDTAYSPQFTTDANGYFSTTINVSNGVANVEIYKNVSGAGAILTTPINFTSVKSYDAPDISVSTGDSINTTQSATGKINATISPSNIDQTMTFSSSNPSVITVDNNGNWKAIAKGSADIIITPKANPALTKTIPVTVTANDVDIAQAAVNNLFSNPPTNTTLKDSTTQAMIDAASVLVNALPAGADKTKMQNDIATANSIAKSRFITLDPVYFEDGKISGTGTPNQKVVLGIYTNITGALYATKDIVIGADGKYTTDLNNFKIWAPSGGVINPSGTASIAVGAYVRAGTVDAEFAHQLVTSRLTDATTAVNNLFSNAPTNTVLKDTTTQAMIDAASALVNPLPASADKTKLAGDVATANTLFNQMTQTTISALTTDSTSVSGKGEPNAAIVIKNGSTTIASGKVASDGTYYFNIAKQAGGSTVTATVTKASNSKTSSASTTVVDTGLDAATASVNALFADAPTNSVLKDTTTQAMIDAAKAKVDALSSNIPEKAELQGDINKANTLFNQIVATTIGSLTSDSTTVSGKGEPNAAIVIKNGSTTIASGKVASDGTYYFNIAKQAGGSTVTATVTKASNSKTSSASTTVVDTGLDAATASVNALFADAPTNSVLKDTTTQAMIDAAKAKVDALSSNIPEKAELTGDINKANTLFNQIVATTIGSLTTDSTTVSGLGEPNAAIVIKNGSTTIASGKVASDGTYYFNIAKQAAGSTIIATVTKASNSKTSSASTTIADESIAPTTINSLTADATTVSGTGEANGTIVIKNGATTIASGKVASDGNYMFFIQKQAAGSTITATVTKASNGKVSSASTTIPDNGLASATASVDALFADAPTNSVLKDTTTQAMIDAAKAKVDALSSSIPEKAALSAEIANANTLFNHIDVTTIGTLTADSTTVSGKGEANANIVIKNGSTTIASGKVASDGTYSFSIAKQAGGSTIVATVTKASNGKTSSASTTIPNVIDYSLKADSYKIGTANLTGTYGKNISKVRLFVNGTLIVQATTNNGAFTFANISSFITKPTDKVEVVGVDGAYVERARVSVTVTGDPVYDYSLTANDYTLGNATLTGKYGKDVSKVRLWVNNVVVAQATTNADGTYSFDKVPTYVKLATDKVEVVGVNAAYQEVARKTVTTKGTSILDTSLTPNAYTKDSANLTGTYGKDISKVRLWVNGVVVAQASTSGTNFTFTNIASFIKNKTDLVEVVGVDAQYKELNRKTVTLNGFDTLDNTLTVPATFTLGTDTSISGTFGTNVANVRLSVNGVIVKQASKAGNVYTLAGVGGLITSTSDVVEIVGVDSQYKEVARKAVTVKTDGIVYDYTLNVNPYTFGDATITGAYGTDVTAVRLWVNGVVIKTAALKDGAFTISGLATITSTADKVEVVAVNASFKEVQRIVIQ